MNQKSTLKEYVAARDGRLLDGRVLMYLLKRVFKQKTFLLVLIQSIFAFKLSFWNIFVDSKYLIFPPITRLVTITTHNSY